MYDVLQKKINDDRAQKPRTRERERNMKSVNKTQPQFQIHAEIQHKMNSICSMLPSVHNTHQKQNFFLSVAYFIPICLSLIQVDWLAGGFFHCYFLFSLPVFIWISKNGYLTRTIVYFVEFFSLSLSLAFNLDQSNVCHEQKSVYKNAYNFIIDIII